MQINLGGGATVIIHDEAESMGGTGDALPIGENRPITITDERSEYEVERVTAVAGSPWVTRGKGRGYNGKGKDGKGKAKGKGKGNKSQAARAVTLAATASAGNRQGNSETEPVPRAVHELAVARAFEYGVEFGYDMGIERGYDLERRHNSSGKGKGRDNKGMSGNKGEAMFGNALEVADNTSGMDGSSCEFIAYKDLHGSMISPMGSMESGTGIHSDDDIHIMRQRMGTGSDGNRIVEGPRCASCHSLFVRILFHAPDWTKVLCRGCGEQWCSWHRDWPDYR